MHQRLFLGIPIPEAVKAQLVEYVHHFRSSISSPNSIAWVRSENYHITVSFFGNVEEATIPRLIDVLKQTTQDHSRITFHFEHITLAPPKKTPRMIWATFSNPHFNELVKAVSRSIQELNMLPGFTHSHEAIPHITMARFKRKAGLQEATLPVANIGNFEANTLSLFRSQLHPYGAVYTPLQTFLLH